MSIQYYRLVPILEIHLAFQLLQNLQIQPKSMDFNSETTGSNEKSSKFTDFMKFHGFLKTTDLWILVKSADFGGFWLKTTETNL